MSSKWKSRKWWVSMIGAVAGMVAILGYDVEVIQVAACEALVAVWVLAEAIVDAARASK